jgi:hypothetical protein
MFSRRWNKNEHLGSNAWLWGRFFQLVHYLKYTFWILCVPYFMFKLGCFTGSLRDLSGDNRCGIINLVDHEFDFTRPTRDPSTADMHNKPSETLQRVKQLIEGVNASSDDVLPETKEQLAAREKETREKAEKKDKQDFAFMISDICAVLDSEPEARTGSIWSLIDKFRKITQINDGVEKLFSSGAYKVSDDYNMEIIKKFSLLWSRAVVDKHDSQELDFLYHVLHKLEKHGRFRDLSKAIPYLLYKSLHPDANMVELNKTQSSLFDTRLNLEWLAKDFLTEVDDATGREIYIADSDSRECKEIAALQIWVPIVVKDTLTTYKEILNEHVDFARHMMKDFEQAITDEDIAWHVHTLLKFPSLMETIPIPDGKYETAVYLSAFAELCTEIHPEFSYALSNFLMWIKKNNYRNWEFWVPCFIHKLTMPVNFKSKYTETLVVGRRGPVDDTHVEELVVKVLTNLGKIFPGHFPIAQLRIVDGVMVALPPSAVNSIEELPTIVNNSASVEELPTIVDNSASAPNAAASVEELPTIVDNSASAPNAAVDELPNPQVCL